MFTHADAVAGIRRLAALYGCVTLYVCQYDNTKTTGHIITELRRWIVHDKSKSRSPIVFGGDQDSFVDHFLGFITIWKQGENRNFAAYLSKLSTDFEEIFWSCAAWRKYQHVRFWHRRRSSVNFGGARHFCPKIYA